MNKAIDLPAMITASSVLLLLAGCTTHYRNRIHPEYGQTEFDRDWCECRRENSAPAAVIAGAHGSAGMVVNENMAMACFRVRGWYRVSSDSVPPKPTPPLPRRSWTSRTGRSALGESTSVA